MNYLAGLTLGLAVPVLAGCASAHKSTVQAPPPPAILTPDNSLTATVAMYNPAGRFMVLSFPADRLPKAGQMFFIYHGGLKAGEVKITGPENENRTVADLISGEVQVGDQVREQ